MDFNNVVDAEDKISKLPDSLLDCILSLLDTKCVARTSILSKRWKDILKSIPILAFEYEDLSETSKVEKFMDFVDRTLRLHDSSNIQKFSLEMHGQMYASRVHSWIENVARLDVKELILSGIDTLPIPLSLFTCESMTRLCLHSWFRDSISIQHFPENISFPNLKNLDLVGVQFKDGCWNEQLFSNSPVLEKLYLITCTWIGMKSFRILALALEVLFISDAEGLQDCDLQIRAPRLVSLTIQGSEVKDYDLSRFEGLDRATVDLYGPATVEQMVVRATATSRFLRALSHVRCLSMTLQTAQVLSSADDFVNNLSTFCKLYMLEMRGFNIPDKLIVALLKATPILKFLTFGKWVLNADDRGYDETQDLFPQTVYFVAPEVLS